MVRGGGGRALPAPCVFGNTWLCDGAGGVPARPHSGRTPAAQKLCPVWWDAVCSGPHIGGCWLSFPRARVQTETLGARPQAAGCHHGDRVDPAGLGASQLQEAALLVIFHFKAVVFSI